MIKVKYDVTRVMTTHPMRDDPTLTAVTIPVTVDFSGSTDPRVRKLGVIFNPYVEFYGDPTDCMFCYKTDVNDPWERSVQLDHEESLDIYSQLIGDLPIIEHYLDDEE